LLHDIDSAIADVSAYPALDMRRAQLLGLVSLRRNLFPDAAGYGKAAA
jgi:hypothetical protein